MSERSSLFPLLLLGGVISMATYSGMTNEDVGQGYQNRDNEHKVTCVADNQEVFNGVAKGAVSIYNPLTTDVDTVSFTTTAGEKVQVKGKCTVVSLPKPAK